jgi:hypothetical protein
MVRTIADKIGHKPETWAGIICIIGAAAVLPILLFLLFVKIKDNASTASPAPPDKLPSQLSPLTSLPTSLLGTARTYNESGELIIVDNINPLLTQQEQGIDDRSGYAYPCVTAPGNGNVCQRQLSEAEATAQGH